MRLLAFIYAKPHLKDQNISIYDFMPLAGDPSPEEIKRIQQEDLEKRMIEAREFKDELKKRLGYAGV